MKNTYKQGLEDALKAVQNTNGGSCLCGHFDSCSGACKPEKSDFVNAIKKLIKNIK